MFRTTVNEEYVFFDTVEEAIETIKDIFSSNTCIFQKVTNWTRITKNGNSSCQVSFIKIENGVITPTYIQYLWVRQQNLSSDNSKIIYIPTETGLPVLEAGRAK